MAIRSMVTTDDYRDGFDGVFRKKEKCQHLTTKEIQFGDDIEYTCSKCGAVAIVTTYDLVHKTPDADKAILHMINECLDAGGGHVRFIGDD